MKADKGQFAKKFFTNGTCSYAVKMFFFLFLANILIRLPLYFSNHFWFDGDEAIIGIMAQDVLETGKIPFFFYGQQYGFATVETLFSAFFIFFLGSKVIALKLAGMVIHSLAILFLSLTLRAKQVNPRAHLFLLLFILLFPPFYLWASQMRTTAFLLAGILFFLTETKSFSWTRFVLVFIISFLLLEAQAMFFLFAMIFVGNWMWKSSFRWVSMITFFLGLLMLMVVTNFYISNGQAAHSVQLIFGVEQMNQLFLQLKGILPGFSGFHYFTSDVPLPGWFTFLPSLLLSVCLLWLLFWSFSNWKKERRILLFFVFALIGYLVFLSGFKDYGPRYWINFYGGVLLLMTYFFIRSKHANGISNTYFGFLALFLTVLFAAPSMKVHFYETESSERKAFEALNHEVRHSERKALFTTDVYLQWQWNYLNGKEIPCCSFIEEERTSEFSHSVFDQYRREPKSVGLIGYWGLFWEMDFIQGFNDQRYQVGGKYYFLKEIQPDFYRRGLEVVGK